MCSIANVHRQQLPKGTGSSDVLFVPVKSYDLRSVAAFDDITRQRTQRLGGSVERSQRN